MNLYDILYNIYGVLKILFKKIFKYREKCDELSYSIEKLKDEEKKLKKSVLALKRKKSIDESKLIPFSFSVLVAAGIGNLLNILSTSIDIFNNTLWICSTSIIITLTIFFIIYVFENFPIDQKIILKIIVVGFSSMTIFSLIRYQYFLNKYLKSGGVSTNILSSNYIITLSLIGIIGILFIINAKLEKNINKKHSLGLAGASMILIIPIFMFIMKPNFGG